MEPQRFRTLAGFDLVPSQCHVYICGNPTMIEDVEAMVVARGFKKHTPRHPGTLHMEKYWTD